MNVQEQLLSKNGVATIKLAKELIKYSIGQKIPTVTEISNNLSLVRGTVQNAMKNLVEAKAVVIESKGHLGTYLVKKNTSVLLKYAGIDSLVGAMPLPYTKRYEGLASGLISSMENKYSIPINMAYMRGAQNRLNMLLQNRYDFAITSRWAAETFESSNDDIEIIFSLGAGSYLSRHVVMFHDKKAKEIKDGMKVGVDSSSIDMRTITELVCKDKKVEYVEIEYSKMMERIISGEIDATIKNIDETLDKHLDINYQNIESLDERNTEAVIVVSKNKKELVYLLKELIDPEVVLNIQKLVIAGKITPSY